MSIMPLTLEIPDELATALPFPPEERQKRLSIELACTLYGRDWLSFGQGARLADLSQERFAWELGERNIARHYTELDAEHDLAYASRQQYVSRH